jgi:beta-lactamase superfamily II metal-dependent hydrolase
MSKANCKESLRFRTEMNVNIQAIKMSNGDFFVVKYEGVSGARHVVLLDMGYQSAYFYAKKTALADVEEIDLCVLSHIHEDHIGGALRYVNDVCEGEDEPIVKEWWFNAKRVAASVSSTKVGSKISPRQANEIAAYLSTNYDTKQWKNNIRAGQRYGYDGLAITVLSPKTTIECEDVPYGEDERVNVQLGRKVNDYDVAVKDFDVTKFTEDTKEEHRSCVALLLDFAEKRFLWMADALPSVVSESLRKLGYSKKKPLECEYMTLSHHGSKGNTSMELLSMIRCEKYIVTGDGANAYNLPDKETLARVIRHCGEDVQLYTTAMDWELRDVFKADGKYSIEEKSVFEI